MGRFEGRVKLDATPTGETSWRTARVWPTINGAIAKTVTPNRIADAWVKSLQQQGRSPIVQVEGEYLVVSAN